MSRILKVLPLILLLPLACSKSGSSDSNHNLSFNNPEYNAQEYAISGIENAASTSEGNNTPTTLLKTSRVQRMMQVQSTPKLAGDCTTLAFGACESGESLLNFNSCTVSDGSGNSLTLQGSISVLFSATSNGAFDQPTCTAFLSGTGTLPSGDSLNLYANETAIFTSMAQVPQYDGMKVIQDFNPGTAWDGTTFPNANQGYVISNSGASRTIGINGIHDGIIGPNGATWINYVTAGQITATGTLAAGNRTVPNGAQLETWDNAFGYKVVHTTGNDSNGNPVTWTSPTCCHPTEGQITSVFSGSINGTSTLTFSSSSCGAVTYVDIHGNSNSINLGGC